MKSILFATGLVLLSTTAFAREQIRIVGSSTVYPFTTAVAEAMGKQATILRVFVKTPIVESTGTGGGFKLFCEGVGVNTPDASNASRAIKKGEFDECKKNGVQVIELKVGIDGLTITQSKSGPKMSLTMAQIFLALAKQVPDSTGKMVANPYVNWSDIDPSLPKVKIEVLGPPPTSGTRDSFHELFMEVGAKAIPAVAALDSKAFEAAWKSIRSDGAYVEAGENDNVIVQKLQSNRNAFGIFGYSFLEENTATLRGVAINGVEPDYDTISSGKYKGSRPLYIYFKANHIGVIPNIEMFMNEYMSERATGEDGYLSKKGLVALPKNERAGALVRLQDVK
jgi:phosphate transport system substrate-binding protein